jgi:hypothetical protein
MSQESVDVVRDAAAAFNRGDLDTCSEFWSDDIDYRAVEGAIDDRGPMHGKAAVRAYVQDWLDNFDNFRSEAVELLDTGEDTPCPPRGPLSLFGAASCRRAAGVGEESRCESSARTAQTCAILTGWPLRFVMSMKTSGPPPGSPRVGPIPGFTRSRICVRVPRHIASCTSTAAVATIAAYVATGRRRIHTTR